MQHNKLWGFFLLYLSTQKYFLQGCLTVVSNVHWYGTMLKCTWITCYSQASRTRDVFACSLDLSYNKMSASSKNPMRSVQPSKQHMFSGKLTETELAQVFYRGLMLCLELLTLIKRLFSSGLLRMIMRFSNLYWLLLILCNLVWGHFEIKCIMHKLLDSSVEKEKEKMLYKGTVL